MDEIINKVSNSVLEVFDLEDYYPKGIRTQIDISKWLYEGFLLREKDFREALKNHNSVILTQEMVLKYFGDKNPIAPPDFLLAKGNKEIYGIEVGYSKEGQSREFSIRFSSTTRVYIRVYHVSHVIGIRYHAGSLSAITRGV